ncbi:MAG TPA: tetratricopeptide repeat protein [Gemmatimonadaceae bacterium]
MQHPPSGGSGSGFLRRQSRETAETRDFVDRARRASIAGACDEAIGWYDRALLSLQQRTPTPELADVLRWKGTVHADCGDTSEADRLYRESGAAATACGYARGEAHALNCRATIAQRRGELAVAEALYHQASELAEDANDSRLNSMILRNLGIVASIRGHHELAIVRFHESYEKAREIGDEDGQCRALNNVATAYMEIGRFHDAEATYTSAIKLARKRGDRAIECGSRINLCEAMIGAGKLSDAEVECMAALGIADWRGDRLRRAEGLKVLAVIARHRGRDAEAEALLDEAFDLSHAGEDVLLTAQLHCEKGEIYRMRRQERRALEHFEAAREIYTRTGSISKAESIERTVMELEGKMSGRPSDGAAQEASPPPA